MMNDTAGLITSLKNLRLFSGLDELQLAQIANAIEVVELAEGQPLPLPTDRDYPFYLIVEGRLRQERRIDKNQIEEHLFKKEDIFGAEMLLLGKRRNYRIEALDKAVLYKIESAKLAWLLRRHTALKVNIRQQLVIYRLLRRGIFSWVSEDESVYLIVRQHPAYLLTSLIKALLVGWLAVIIFITSRLIEVTSFRLVVGWVALLIGVVAVVWGLWIFLDWLNDYYIVTDQRVVWLERIIFIYDSRQEAPLVAIRAEEVTTSFLGRLLGFGDVITYTFLGRVTFRGIAYPYTVRAKIQALRKQMVTSQVRTDHEAMAAMLRDKLNPPVEPLPETSEAAPAAGTRSKTSRLRPAVPLAIRIRQYFQTYVVEDGIITYRKHFFILLRKVWLPTTVFLLTLASLVFLRFWVALDELMGMSNQGLTLIMLFVLFVTILWWLYQYVDWRNDIYQITPDKIIDSERKPLGTEITKSAPLENILSLDYERIGLLGVLLNMGNVIINTGTDKLVWLTITNPARAQRDIFNHMIEQRRRKEHEDATKRWDHESDWLVTYDHVKREEAQSQSEESQSS